jgi:hypothetical protein
MEGEKPEDVKIGYKVVLVGSMMQRMTYVKERAVETAHNYLNLARDGAKVHLFEVTEKLIEVFQKEKKSNG